MAKADERSAMEERLHVLLTRWPTLETSPQVMGPLAVMVAAGFNTEGCGAMTTGDWVAVVTKGWKEANQRSIFFF